MLLLLLIVFHPKNTIAAVVIGMARALFPLNHRPIAVNASREAMKKATDLAIVIQLR